MVVDFTGTLPGNTIRHVIFITQANVIYDVKIGL